jgi:hypothetical protein
MILFVPFSVLAIGFLEATSGVIVVASLNSLSSTVGVEEELPAPPPSASPVYQVLNRNDPNDVFAFDWIGVNTVGQPDKIVRVAFFFDRDSNSDQREVVAFDRELTSAGTLEFLIRDVLRSVTPGRFRLKCQLKSETGLWSAFSNDIFIEIPGSPSGATGLRFEARP